MLFIIIREKEDCICWQHNQGIKQIDFLASNYIKPQKAKQGGKHSFLSCELKLEILKVDPD